MIKSQNKIKIILFTILIFALAFSLFYFSHEKNNKYFGPQNLIYTSSTKKIVMQDLDGKIVKMGSPCSLAQKGNDIVFCDYLNLYLLDATTGRTTLIKKPASVKSWHPTGVHWHEKTHTLYVANYFGHDVLSFKFNNKNEIVLQRRYIHHDMVEPENIDVTKDGRLLAVADYGNNRVLLFTTKGDFLWSRPVGSAHSVCFTSDEQSLLVSGLTPPKIYKFSLSGACIAQKGEEGWLKDGYLWPTFIVRWKNNYIVSDAHTGKLTLINDQLDTVDVMGGNGLGEDLFNMPYGLSISPPHHLWVTDAFKQRILEINSLNKHIECIYEASPLESKTLDGDYRSPSAVIHNQPPLGLTYDHRTNTENAAEILWNRSHLPSKWNGSYGGIGNIRSRFCTFGGSVHLLKALTYYWVFIKNYTDNGKVFTLINSPESPYCLVIYNGITYPIKIGFDFWMQKNDFVSTRGKKIPFFVLTQKAMERIEKYQKALKDTCPLKAMPQHIFSNQRFSELFPTAFQSLEGKEFYKELLGSKNAEDQRKAAFHYLKSIEGKNYLYFSEIVIASMILADPL